MKFSLTLKIIIWYKNIVLQASLQKLHVLICVPATCDISGIKIK